MKTPKVTFNKRLNRLDSTYFGKDYTEVTTEKALIGHLATYLFDSDTQIDEEGWKNIMAVRELFPDVWWSTLEALFKGHHDT